MKTPTWFRLLVGEYWDQRSFNPYLADRPLRAAYNAWLVVLWRPFLCATLGHNMTVHLDGYLDAEHLDRCIWCNRCHQGADESPDVVRDALLAVARRAVAAAESRDLTNATTGGVENAVAAARADWRSSIFPFDTCTIEYCPHYLVSPTSQRTGECAQCRALGHPCRNGVRGERNDELVCVCPDCMGDRCDAAEYLGGVR